MNLSEREQAFLDEIRRVFPDAREVTEGGVRVINALAETSAIRVTAPPSVTSQVSLFGQEG